MFRFASNGIVPPDPNYPLSLRTTRTSWAGKGRTQKTDKGQASNKEHVDWRRNGSRIILFSLGGMTYSEVRSAYEISKEAQRDLYFGSTFVYNPTQFIDVLKELHKTDLPTNVVSPNSASPPDLEKKDLDKKEPEKEKKAGLFSKKK